MSVKQKIIQLTEQLYPKGRVFNLLNGGWLKGLHEGLAVSETDTWNDANSVINHSLLPDNDFFDADDATIWEGRLAIPVSSGATLADRKAAILRKWRYPGTAKARAHRLFIQSQLNLAGFTDVVLYENRIDDGAGGITTLDPYSFNGYQHGEFEHGEFEHGGTAMELLVNYIDSDRDANFDLNGNYSTTFFVASPDFGTIDSLGVVTPNYISSSANLLADIPLIRREEFRELLLRLKPAKTIGVLLINYI
tara:strand:+ start:2188 stop:2937 length:750 start_codon:yes stop_codon:yes gene_type:complete